MRNWLYLNGVDSRDFGLYISGAATFLSPVRLAEEVTVPGRDGRLLLPNSRLDNVSIVYPAFIAGPDMPDKLEALKAFLLSLSGYVRLSDTYHPDRFRLASFQAGIIPEVSDWFRAAQFEIEFNCKPQVFLTSGELVKSFSASGSIVNPTPMTAKPLIRVYGDGSFEIGDVEVTVTDSDVYTDIDCDIQECYKGATNCNGNVTFSGHKFPELHSGVNGIVLNGVTLDITPRWWTV